MDNKCEVERGERGECGIGLRREDSPNVSKMARWRETSCYDDTKVDPAISINGDKTRIWNNGDNDYYNIVLLGVVIKEIFKCKLGIH